MRIILCLLFAPIFTLSFHASAANISYVYDGDTVKINDNNTEYKLRLTDIDAPERNQAYGKKSRRALIGLCSQANIHAALSGTDKYNRRLGKLSHREILQPRFLRGSLHRIFPRRFYPHLHHHALPEMAPC